MDLSGYELNNLTALEKNRLKSSIYRNKYSKKLSHKDSKEFCEAIDTIDKYLSNISFDEHYDRNNGLNLYYPRTSFINEINDLLSDYSIDERNIVLSQYGFSLQDENNILTINLYPFLPENIKVITPVQSRFEQGIKDRIQYFTFENKINLHVEHSGLSSHINIICKTLPEFHTTIGKIQHKTHKYTLDIHLLRTLKEFVTDEFYQTLTNEEKIISKIAILIHDISKKEATIDKTHPMLSAIDSIAIINRLLIPKTQKIEIFNLIKNHHWCENIDNKSKTYKEISKDFYSVQQFRIAKAFAEADLKAVGGDFFYRFKDNLAISSEAIESILLRNN